MSSSKFSTPTTLTTSSVLIDTAGVSDKRNLVYSSISGKFIATVQAIPVGTVRMYVSDTAPSNYLICNGQAISRTTYSALWAVLGTKYGSGDGSTTFNLPNLIDYAFPYGSASNTSLPTTRNIGSSTFDSSHSHNTTLSIAVDSGGSKSHNHSHNISGNESVSHTHNFGNSSANSGAHSHLGQTTSTAHSHTYGTSNTSGSGNTGGISGNHTHNINNASASHNHNVNAASGHTHPSSNDGGTHSSHNFSITFDSNTLSHTHTLTVATGLYFYIRFQ
jgi:microcystin-dependent protein